MKKNYETPQMDVMIFGISDVITGDMSEPIFDEKVDILD